jgi:hypothetical protein
MERNKVNTLPRKSRFLEDVVIGFRGDQGRGFFSKANHFSRMVRVSIVGSRVVVSDFMDGGVDGLVATAEDIDTEEHIPVRTIVDAGGSYPVARRWNYCSGNLPDRDSAEVPAYLPGKVETYHLGRCELDIRDFLDIPQAALRVIHQLQVRYRGA